MTYHPQRNPIAATPAEHEAMVLADAAPPMPPRVLDAVPAARLEPEPLEWLWPGRFALGKLGLLLGDPDNGKSLIAIDMAARVSRGSPWPDGTPSPAGHVLLVTTEDGLLDTVRPRLEAAGADLERVHVFCGSRTYKGGVPTGDHNFSIKADAESLEAWLDRTGEVRLVILDPLGAHTDGIDVSRENAVRDMLQPLARLARRRDLAILGVVHTNKSAGGKAIYRASGSLAFVGAARHVYAVGRDAADPRRRYMAHVKNNLAGDTSGLAFAIKAGAGNQPVIAWEEQRVAIRAESVLGGDATRVGPIEEAEAWLMDMLAAGPVAARTLRRQAHADGLAWRTIQRAKARIGAETRRNSFGADADGSWRWALPASPPG